MVTDTMVSTGQKDVCLYILYLAMVPDVEHQRSFEHRGFNRYSGVSAPWFLPFLFKILSVLVQNSYPECLSRL